MFFLTASSGMDVSSKLNRLREHWSGGKPDEIVVITSDGNFIAHVGDN